jgi:hypothetical protein
MSTDRIILRALQESQAALSRYIEPGGPGEADTINALLGILDHEPLVRAQERAGPPAQGRPENGRIYTRPNWSERKAGPGGMPAQPDRA